MSQKIPGSNTSSASANAESSMANKGQMIVEGNYATIIFNRTFQHRREDVWNAITQPEELKQWLMCTSAKIEPRVGGTIELVSGPAQFLSTGKVLAWEPPRLFEYEWKVAPVEPMPQGEDATFRYELTEQGTATLLTLTYKRITRQTALGFTPGTHVLLDRLASQLDKKALPQWMPRFQELMNLYPAWNK